MAPAVQQRSGRSGSLGGLVCFAAVITGWALLLWAMAAVFGLTGRIAWFLEVPANFVALVVGGALTGLFLLLSLCRARAARWLATVFAILTAFGWATTRPGMESGSPKNGREIRLMTWNTFIGSIDPEKAAREIRRMNPDVVVFIEFTGELRERIDPLLRAACPYYLGSPESGFMGRGVYSRFPISDWQRSRKDTRRLSSCVVSSPDGIQFRLFILHPNVPVREGYPMRARALQLATAAIQKSDLPVVAMGDFNASWASADLRKFCRDNHFIPASRLRPTWNAGFPFFLRTGIDHVFVPAANFEAISSEVGSDGCGSDHLPVMATVRAGRN